MNIVFNPAYILKPDNGRVLILSKENTRENIGGVDSFDGFLHPIHAIILNSLSGDSYENSIKKIGELLEVNFSFVENFISELLQNDDWVQMTFAETTLYFPPNCIIYSDEKRQEIDNNLLIYDNLILKQQKHYTPTDITLMINTLCATDCIYCYADRRNQINSKISLSRIKELIDEAKKLNARSFDIIGGEFFLYRYWEELLIHLKKSGFDPFLSTKIPMNENMIIKLKKIGIKDIQISLDSLISNNLCDILNVKESYFNKIQRTFELLDKYNIKTIVHTILNNKNDTVDDMESIFNFLQNFKNIEYWKPDLAGPSLYLKNIYEDYKPRTENIKILLHFFEKKGPKSNFRINYGGLDNFSEDNTKNFEEKRKEFNNRGLCTGNFSAMFILPDGNVTICEELYWHEKFILGNVINDSLINIWNSDKANYLKMIPQKDFPSDSPCANCSEYYTCREIKQVCWRDIVKGYGKEKWYFPDVKCPKAPKVKSPVSFY